MKLLLLLPLLLLSCNTQPDTEPWKYKTLTYSIDPIVINGLSQVEANNIIRAVFKEWSSLGVVKLRYKMSPSDITVKTRPLLGNVAGFGYFPPNGTLLIDSSNRYWTKDLLTRVVRHEVGHVLGLVHDSSIHSVMYRKIMAKTKINKWDKIELEELYK